MKFPFTIDMSDEVRSQYCEKLCQQNLEKAFDYISTEVERTVLYTYTTEVNIDFKLICRRYSLNASTSGMADGSTPILKFRDMVPELLERLRLAFPEGRVELTPNHGSIKINWSKQT
jgi:hypothetical protein